jgi:hypothetical protein
MTSPMIFRKRASHLGISQIDCQFQFEIIVSLLLRFRELMVR